MNAQDLTGVHTRQVFLPSPHQETSRVKMSGWQERRFAHGLALASVLSGAWRSEPPGPAPSPQVLSLLPQIRTSGTAGLVYWRQTHTSHLGADSSPLLRAEYLNTGARAAQTQFHIGRIVSTLRKAGIEPILFKGWAVARLYPDAGMRPCGDIDLFVPPGAMARAHECLADMRSERVQIDLHALVSDKQHATRVVGRSLEDLYAHSQAVPVADTHMRVLSPEDHLHLLCLHFLRHGGWRPLWLVDIAVALESRPENFDWGRCMGEGREADWIACAVGAAHRLLDARIQDTPCTARSEQLPAWFLPAILREWSEVDATLHYPPDPIHLVWKHPRRLARAIRGRWLNPLEATMLMDGSIDSFPRVWYQAQYFLQKGTGFVYQRAHEPETVP